MYALCWYHEAPEKRPESVEAKAWGQLKRLTWQEVLVMVWARLVLAEAYESFLGLLPVSLVIHDIANIIVPPRRKHLGMCLLPRGALLPRETSGALQP